MSWSHPNGPALIWAIGTAIFGFLILWGLMYVPANWRKPLIGLATFLAGAVYVAYFLWPTAQTPRGSNDIPSNAKESVAFWLSDAIPIAGNVSNSLSIFLLGLGIYSLMRIHLKRLFGCTRIGSSVRSSSSACC